MLWRGFRCQTNRFRLSPIQQTKIRYFSDSVGEAAQKIVVFIVNRDSKDHKWDGVKFPQLRDNFISRCKQDLLL
jgi:hypothetical protein